MYKILLVDDEINILEGIAALVDWKSCCSKVIAKASHGQMALDLMQKELPDIIITDNKMPGINGLELIKRVHESYSTIRFIILSGYDEFEYAKQAMQFGVKHYLLKPSNESKIEEALKQVVNELDELKNKEMLISKMRNNLEIVMPKAKEQLLKELITKKILDLDEWVYYQKMLGINEETSVRLLVFEISEEHEYEHIFKLKEMVNERLEEGQMIYFSTSIGEKVLVLLEEQPLKELMGALKPVNDTFKQMYQLSFTTAISNPDQMMNLKNLYNETLICLSQRFYLREGSTITKNELNGGEPQKNKCQFNHEDLIFSIRSGDITEVRKYLDAFFLIIEREKYDVDLVKSHCLDLYLSIIRQTNEELMDSLYENIVYLRNINSLEQMKEFIDTTSYEVTKIHSNKTKQVQSSIIKKVMEYVDKNFHDPSLSLATIANDICYMNSDYLGKLFKKEKGEKFSNYVVKLRVDKAIEIIQSKEEVKMFEVAEAVGFGDNPRYFSQVFKKYTGCTPSEYRKTTICREASNRRH